jgi:two-component system, NarL family, invasion response regulator UvrY
MEAATKVKKIKVLIIDDHAVVRQGLKTILADISGVNVAGEASNSADALRLLREQEWGLVLLDISLPGKSGLELLKVIKGEHPGTPVLVLSMYPEDQYALRVLKSGADGYLTKESAPDQLVHAVRKVASGGKYISQAVAEKMAGELVANRTGTLHDALSNREFEILRLIASGKTLTQIAEDIRLSVKTVSTYRTRIMAKTGLHNNAEITHYAIKNGLVQ